MAALKLYNDYAQRLTELLVLMLLLMMLTLTEKWIGGTVCITVQLAARLA